MRSPVRFSELGAERVCSLTRALYLPSRRPMSSAWVPSSTIRPFCTTAILSAARTVLSRCATTTVVRPSIRPSSALCTTRSDSASSAEVASSSSRILGSLMMARAMAMRCFWPPLICVPRSPHRVSYPSGRAAMKLWALALLAAATTSASLASGLP